MSINCSLILQQVYESKLFPFFHGKFLESAMHSTLKDNLIMQLNIMIDPVSQRKLGVDGSCNGSSRKNAICNFLRNNPIITNKVLNTTSPRWFPNTLLLRWDSITSLDQSSLTKFSLGQTFKQLGPKPKSPLDSFHEREVHKLNDQTFKQLGSSQNSHLVKPYYS